jgi:signal transduction histidine kinase
VTPEHALSARTLPGVSGGHSIMGSETYTASSYSVILADIRWIITIASVVEMKNISNKRADSAKTAPNVWERWFVVWHIIFYALLALATGLALLDPDSDRKDVLLVLALLLGVWHWGMVVRHPQWLRHRIGPLLVYFAGALLLLAALVALQPAYMFLLGAFYPLMFSSLPLRTAMAGALALTAVLFWRQISRSEQSLQAGWLLPVMIGATLIGILVTVFIDQIIHQSSERQRLIEELEATRHELAAMERQAGVLEERQRLAHDIHDTLAQGFTSVVMHLEALEQALPTGAETAQRHLDQARDAAREGLAETRQLVWALRPEQLERAALPQALGQVVERWSAAADIPAVTTITGASRPLAPQIEVTLLRAAQEALANVRKHARASHVTLTLSYMGDTVVLDVHDDGGGFDPARHTYAEQSAGGFGLLAMRERVEQLGGMLAIESMAGAGTTLAIELPVICR